MTTGFHTDNAADFSSLAVRQARLWIDDLHWKLIKVMMHINHTARSGGFSALKKYPRRVNSWE
jgi:hypothetical protein